MRGDVSWDGHGRHRAVVAPKRLSGVFPGKACRQGWGAEIGGVWESSGLGRRMLPQPFQ